MSNMTSSKNIAFQQAERRIVKVKTIRAGPLEISTGRYGDILLQFQTSFSIPSETSDDEIDYSTETYSTS